MLLGYPKTPGVKDNFRGIPLPPRPTDDDSELLKRARKARERSKNVDSLDNYEAAFPGAIS